jgi:hypothetical protein
LTRKGGGEMVWVESHARAEDQEAGEESGKS